TTPPSIPTNLATASLDELFASHIGEQIARSVLGLQLRGARVDEESARPAARHPQRVEQNFLNAYGCARRIRRMGIPCRQSVSAVGRPVAVTGVKEVEPVVA